MIWNIFGVWSVGFSAALAVCLIGARDHRTSEMGRRLGLLAIIVGSALWFVTLPAAVIHAMQTQTKE